MAVVLQRARKSARKRRDSYHHGDLRRALVAEAVRTIGAHGIEALTLREVGKRLGVSRTALYRHFSDKSALLAAVAREGFQQFRSDLLAAWERAGRGPGGFRAMGIAYVQFALGNPSHYRVMFGGFRNLCEKEPGLENDATAAFQVLVDALTSLQPSRSAEGIDRLARYVWATVHGIAMLAIDGQLGQDPRAASALMEFAADQLAGSCE